MFFDVYMVDCHLNCVTCVQHDGFSFSTPVQHPTLALMDNAPNLLTTNPTGCLPARELGCV